jgi:hypothetical protein
MQHTVEFVARTQRLDIEKFVEFAKNHRGAFVDRFSGLLVTSTLFVDDLINDFLAAGNEHLPWVKDPAGGLIQPGMLEQQ